MDLSPFWARATSIPERTTTGRDLIPTREPQTEHANRRLTKWKSRRPFDSTVHFSDRLAADSLDETILRGLLSESDAALESRLADRPEWYDYLVHCYNSPAPPITSPDIEEVIRLPGSGFLNWWRPVLGVSYNRVLQHAVAVTQANHVLVDATSTTDQLYSSLCRTLLNATLKTLTLELHVSRLTGELRGDSPENRYDYFVDQLNEERRARALMSEYPVLAKYVSNQAIHWVESSVEFLTRLIDDWDCLQAMLGGQQLRLQSLRTSVGDKHRRGRSVIVCEFSQDSRIVYKPRSLSVDRHFQQILEWMNPRVELPDFRTVVVLDRGDYGWMEFVRQTPCTNASQISRFYQRQGGTLAILSSLGAIDIHNENVIASGEYPIIVDLESLFHPVSRYLGDLVDMEQAIARVMTRSVTQVGLLPFRTTSWGGRSGIEASGIGGLGGQPMPTGGISVENANTDRMILGMRNVFFAAAKNRPLLRGGDEIRPQDYVGDVEVGFLAVYDSILKHRDEFLCESGPVAAFGKDAVRVVLRPTEHYAALIRESFHPDLLRDGIDRDCHLDMLWLDAASLPYLKDTIGFEREDLDRGDIPFFWGRPGDRDIFASNGGKLKDFLPTTALDDVVNGIRAMNKVDRKRQIWLIRASMVTLEANTGRQIGSRAGCRPEKQAAMPKVSCGTSEWLSIAVAIGERLDELAIRNDNRTRANWIGLGLTVNSVWDLHPLGVDIYDGISGIVLFLAYLGEVGPTESRAKFRQLALAAYSEMDRQLESVGSGAAESSESGCFRGWGGVCYALVHLASVWNEPVLLERAATLLFASVAVLPDNVENDIIGGVAGLLGVALTFYEVSPDERILEACVEAGDILLRRATKVGEGIGWLTGNKNQTAPLCGFAHGASGCAWALLRLAGASGQDRFGDAALRAIEYESSLYDGAQGGWPDLREGADSAGNSAGTWCNGAAGISIVRSLATRFGGGTVCKNDLDRAMDIVESSGFGANHSLCHGDLGNAECLDYLRRGDVKTRAEQILSGVLPTISSGIVASGWLCGTPNGVETPGLMTGIAGIGLAALRLARKDVVPSVLRLERPRSPH